MRHFDRGNLGLSYLHSASTLPLEFFPLLLLAQAKLLYLTQPRAIDPQVAELVDVRYGISLLRYLEPIVVPRPIQQSQSLARPHVVATPYN